MTTYTITTWTDGGGTHHAVCEMSPGSIISDHGKHNVRRALAEGMIDEGCDPTARVYFVNENGGKLGSVASLAELGRVKT